MICIKCKKCGFIYNNRFDVCPKCQQDPNKPNEDVFTVSTTDDSVSTPQIEIPSIISNDNNYILIHVLTGKILNISKESTIFGRGEDCDIILNSEKISRAHTQIIKKDNECLLVDCNSLNGTYINDKQLEPQESIKLNNNDIFKVYTVEFKFQEVSTD